MVEPILYVDGFLSSYPLTGVGNIKKNRLPLANLLGIQYQYLGFCDILTDYIERDYELYRKSQILIFTGQLLAHEFEILLINFLYGAYTSAARTARWMLEMSLAASIATVDGSILDKKSNNPMSLKRFQKWLRKHDEDSSSYSINKTEIYRKFGLAQQKIRSAKNTYGKLCEYSHTSTTTFSRSHEDPHFHTTLTVNQPLFETVFSLTMKSIDLSLYCYINALIQTVNMDVIELKKFMRDYMKYDYGHGKSLSSRKEVGFVLPRNIPLTWGLIKKLSK